MMLMLKLCLISLARWISILAQLLSMSCWIIILSKMLLIYHPLSPRLLIYRPLSPRLLFKSLRSHQVSKSKLMGSFLKLISRKMRSKFSWKKRINRIIKWNKRKNKVFVLIIQLLHELKLETRLKVLN